MSTITKGLSGAALSVLVAGSLAACAGPSTAAAPTAPTQTSTSSTMPVVSASRIVNPPVHPLVMPAARPLPKGTTTVHLPKANLFAAGLATVGSAVFAGSGAYRIDAGTHRVSGPFVDPTKEAVLAAADVKGVWLPIFGESVVVHLGRDTGREIGRITLPPDTGPAGVAPAPGLLWVSGHHSGALHKVDVASDKVLATIPLTGKGPWGLDAAGMGFGSIWVSAATGGLVYRVDPVAGRLIASVDTGGFFVPSGGLAAGSASMWVASGSSELGRIDPTTNTLADIYDLGTGAVGQPLAEGMTVWVVAGPAAFDASGSRVPSTHHGYLVHLTDAGTVLTRIDLGAGFVPDGLVRVGQTLWLSDSGDPTRVLVIPGRGLP